MRIFSFFIFLLLAGCQYDPHAHLYTTQKPQAADVAGRYALVSQTVTSDGLAAFQSKPCIIDLRPDGSFTATNVPPSELESPGKNFFNTLLSGSGKWRIDRVGSVDDGSRPLKTHWGIYLNSRTAKIMPVGLSNQKPPYGLIFTLGDPDSGYALILTKTN